MLDIKKPVDYVLFMNEVYYWDYIYKSNHALSCVGYWEKQENILEELKIFDKYKEDEEFFETYVNRDKKSSFENNFYAEDPYFIIRNFANAQIHYWLRGNITFPIEKLSNHELEVLKQLILFCKEWTFYPWDIRDCPSGEAIASYIIEYGAIPFVKSRLPFSYACDRAKLNLQQGKGAVTPSFSGKFKEEMIEHARVMKKAIENLGLSEEYNGVFCNPDIVNYYKRYCALTIKEFSDKTISPQKLQKQAKTSKKIEQPKYRGSRSFWERLFGYMIWEEKDKLHAALNEKILVDKENMRLQEIERKHNRISIIDAYKNFEKLDIVKKILEEPNCGASIISFENRNIERWYKATFESISVGKFISI